MANPLRVILSVIGAAIVLLVFFQGYQAYLAKEYEKFFILFIALILGVNILFIGIKGKKELFPLGKKLTGFGLGLVILAVFLNYSAAGAADVKDNMNNAMAGVIADASAKEIMEQINPNDLPADRAELEDVCSSGNLIGNDETSFTMNDICDELYMEESAGLTSKDIIENAIFRKTGELAREHVNDEVGGNENFDKSLEEISKGKKYILAFFIAGILIFIIGILFVYFGREDKSIYDIVYRIAFSSTVTCAINAAIFGLVGYFIKSLLMTGDLLNNQYFQSMLPKVEGSEGMIQEATRNMLIKVGEVMYNWLGAALNAAFWLSLILGSVFLAIIIIFFFVKKKATGPSSDKPLGS
jgi:phosphoglycerol transferase MdoB-like AlkP superfamily enzyme